MVRVERKEMWVASSLLCWPRSKLARRVDGVPINRCSHYCTKGWPNGMSLTRDLKLAEAMNHIWFLVSLVSNHCSVLRWVCIWNGREDEIATLWVLLHRTLELCHHKDWSWSWFDAFFSLRGLTGVPGVSAWKRRKRLWSSDVERSIANHVCPAWAQPPAFVSILLLFISNSANKHDKEPHQTEHRG